MARLIPSALAGTVMAGCASALPKHLASQEELPDDALPYSQQVYRLPCSNTSTQVTFDRAVSAYQPICSSGLFSDALN